MGLKPSAWALGLGLLVCAGCAPARGPAFTPIVMPHPREAGSYLLLLTGPQPGSVNLNPVNVNTPEGLRRQVVRILGERCANAGIDVEEHIPLAPAAIGDDLQVQAVKVRC